MMIMEKSKEEGFIGEMPVISAMHEVIKVELLQGLSQQCLAILERESY